MPAKKGRAKKKSKPRARKSSCPCSSGKVTQNTKVTVSGAGGGGGGGGYGPPIVYATYAPPIPSMPTSATWESGRGFEPERREMPKFARDSMAQTTSDAAAQTSNKVAQSAIDSYRKLFSGRSSRGAQTQAAGTTNAGAQTTVSLMPQKATYAPRDPGASTSATWESGSGFKPEKREPKRLTDHGVSLTPKHAAVQSQTHSDMSISERFDNFVTFSDEKAPMDLRLANRYSLDIRLGIEGQRLERTLMNRLPRKGIDLKKKLKILSDSKKTVPVQPLLF